MGDGEKVTGIRIKNRITNEESDYPPDGIFVQIGLAANSAPYKQIVIAMSEGAKAALSAFDDRIRGMA